MYKDIEYKALWQKIKIFHLFTCKVSALKQFTDVISGADMSAINVFFVGSVPNSHR